MSTGTSPSLAVSLDAGGTLLQPSDPVALTYARAAGRHGLARRVHEVQQGFRRAFAQPWSGPRYVGDGRPFWRAVVFEALQTDNDELFEELYAHYARPEAWRVDGSLRDLAAALRHRGHPVGLLSNWDDRLRPLLGELGLLDELDAVVVSCELGVDKPHAAAFAEVAERLHRPVQALVHVGDHPRKDVAGAEAAGARGWLWRPGDATELFRWIAALNGPPR